MHGQQNVKVYYQSALSLWKVQTFVWRPDILRHSASLPAVLFANAACTVISALREKSILLHDLLT